MLALAAKAFQGSVETTRRRRYGAPSRKTIKWDDGACVEIARPQNQTYSPLRSARASALPRRSFSSNTSSIASPALLIACKGERSLLSAEAQRLNRCGAATSRRRNASVDRGAPCAAATRWRRSHARARSSKSRRDRLPIVARRRRDPVYESEARRHWVATLAPEEMRSVRRALVGVAAARRHRDRGRARRACSPPRRRCENNSNASNATISRAGCGSLALAAGADYRRARAAVLDSRARLERPIVELIRSAERIGEGDYTSPHKVTSDDEIAELERALDRMRQRLRQTTITKNYLTTVLNSMNDAVLVTSPDGVIAEINDAAVRLFGYSEAGARRPAVRESDRRKRTRRFFAGDCRRRNA